MVYELHIWGPAFALPSIDAECIAASALLSQTLEPDEWVLVPGYDPTCSPNGNFPALRSGSKWVGGFRAIANYLKAQGKSLDHQLSARQHARSEALTAHLSAHGLPILDAHLYSSPSNYASTTRPAYTPILSLPFNYTVPPTRHAAALSRTTPLGLSAAEVDAPPPSTTTDASSQLPHTTTSPSLLFKPRQTLSSVLQSQHSTTHFRLEATLHHLFSPLASLLALSDSTLLHTAHPTTIDCLAIAYLSLLLVPSTPNTNIPATIRANFPTVVRYFDRLRPQLLPPNDTVPWRPPEKPSAAQTLRAITFALMPETARLVAETRLPVLAGGAAGALAVVAAVAWGAKGGGSNAHTVVGREMRGLGRWGDAGKALAVLGGGGSGGL